MWLMFLINSKNLAIKRIHVTLITLNAFIQPSLHLRPLTKPIIKKKNDNEKRQYERLIRRLNILKCKRYLKQYQSMKY